MGNLTFSEIIWIVIIILIVFGPQRLPEMARKVGKFVGKARDAANALQKQITDEYGEAITPLKDVGDEIKQVRRSLTDTAKSAARDLEETTRIKDVTEELKNARRGIVDDAIAATEPAPPDSDAEASQGGHEQSSGEGDS